MKYNVDDIADIVQGKLIIGSDFIPIQIKRLLTDSRKIIHPTEAIFIALSHNRDGHHYIQDAYLAGVRSFLVNQIPLNPTKDSAYVVVNNTLEAIQLLAAWHRKNFSYPVVGITGSNGKTIVKEWLWQLLHEDIHLVRSPRSYNSQIGVPLSVWQMNETHQLAIFEAGISARSEMHKLSQVIEPNIGILTNIGSAHDEGFTSHKEKLLEKLRLFENSSLLIAPVDDKSLSETLLQWQLSHKHVQVITWANSHNKAHIIFDIEKSTKCTFIRLQKGSQSLRIQIPFIDDASIQNACSCMAFLVCINRVSTDVLHRFSKLENIEMRMGLKQGINQCIIINDGYSADLDSLYIAMDFMQQQAAGLERVLILSDLEQTGMPATQLYKEVATLANQYGINKIVGIGPIISANKNLFTKNITCYQTTQDFLKHQPTSEFQQNVILIKGARRFAFEQISNLFEKQIHETLLEINLNNLVHNLNVYKSKLKPNVKLMAMVKASSYGTGSSEIARVLEFHRADYLAVAYADEGIQLRDAGVHLPIMVMNTEATAALGIIKYGLEPVIYNLRGLQNWIKILEGETIGVHLEIDTGMKRLGFHTKDIEACIALLETNENLVVKSVFAHLAASEEKIHDEFTQAQIDLFGEYSKKIESALGYKVLKHILNSSGICRFENAQFDMVRLGIGLYGIDPSNKLQKQLQPIGTLKTVISQLRHLDAHETVGYNRKGTVNKTSIIATVAIGYADGYNRKLGNGKGYMIINGQKAPTIGSICMDMTMLDVSNINCSEGDEVIVFGSELPVSYLAEKTGTIPYEVLTGISQRVKRVYVFE
jgi:alanine racemase